MNAKLLAIALAAFAGATAHAECSYPKAPASVPNGSTATEAEMLDGMQMLKKYNDEMTAYLSCLDNEAKQRILEAGDDKERVKKIQSVTNTRHDAAVVELNTKADEFNRQVRTFRQKQKE